MIKVMNKLIRSASFGFISLLALPAKALAQSKVVTCDPNSGAQFANLCLDASSMGRIINSALTIIFIMATIAALIWLIYGAFKWILSGGDKTAVEEARNHITAAIIGLVIVFLAYFILNFALFFFTGKSLTDLTIPKL